MSEYTVKRCLTAAGVSGLVDRYLPRIFLALSRMRGAMQSVRLKKWFCYVVLSLPLQVGARCQLKESGILWFLERGRIKRGDEIAKDKRG